MVLIEAFKVKVNVMHLHYLTLSEKDRIFYEYPIIIGNKIKREGHGAILSIILMKLTFILTKN